MTQSTRMSRVNDATNSVASTQPALMCATRYTFVHQRPLGIAAPPINPHRWKTLGFTPQPHSESTRYLSPLQSPQLLNATLRPSAKPPGPQHSIDSYGASRGGGAIPAHTYGAARER